jgi:hypothetical protein
MTVNIIGNSLPQSCLCLNKSSFNNNNKGIKTASSSTHLSESGE